MKHVNEFRQEEIEVQMLHLLTSRENVNRLYKFAFPFTNIIYELFLFGSYKDPF